MPEVKSTEVTEQEKNKLAEQAGDLLEQAEDKLSSLPEFRLAIHENIDEAFFGGEVKFVRNGLRYEVQMRQPAQGEKHPWSMTVQRANDGPEFIFDDPTFEEIDLNCNLLGDSYTRIEYTKGRDGDPKSFSFSNKPTAIAHVKDFIESI